MIHSLESSAPPFDAGSPDTAPPEILALLPERIAPFRKRRTEAVQRRHQPGWAFQRHDHIEVNEYQQKKAARFPERPFLYPRQLHIDGQFQAFNTGGPISRLHPDRQPLHIGAVANCFPNRRDGLPSPLR